MQQQKDRPIHLDVSTEALPSKLSRDHLLALFAKMGYQAVLGDAQSSNPSDLVPLYYTHGQILLFPPCTDNPNTSQLNGIHETVRRAFGEKKDLLTTKDWLLFPIFEEWNVLFQSRQSWVLLAYFRTENQFYLLDPTGPKRASVYQGNLQYLNQALQKTFEAPLFSAWKPLVPSYLSFQPLTDSSSSGFWVAYFIERLASGLSLAELLDLSKRKPLMSVQEVRVALSQLNPSQAEDLRSAEDDSSPINSVHVASGLLSGVFQIEKQSYGQPGRENADVDGELVSSFLSSGANGSILANGGGDNPQQQSYGFKLNFYSILIFSGTASALVGLLCLTTVTPAISATVATGVLVVGMALFVAGGLGKCGLFGGAKPLHRDAVRSAGAEFELNP